MRLWWMWDVWLKSTAVKEKDLALILILIKRFFKKWHFFCLWFSFNIFFQWSELWVSVKGEGDGGEKFYVKL